MRKRNRRKGRGSSNRAVDYGSGGVPLPGCYYGMSPEQVFEIYDRLISEGSIEKDWRSRDGLVTVRILEK
jgi:hypothetical protein